jgi:hypothetical protein
MEDKKHSLAGAGLSREIPEKLLEDLYVHAKLG